MAAALCLLCSSILDDLSSSWLPIEVLCILIPSYVLWSSPPPEMIHLWCTCHRHPADAMMHGFLGRSIGLSPLILLEAHFLWCCWSFVLPHMWSSTSPLLILSWMFCFLIATSFDPLAKPHQWSEVDAHHLLQIFAWSSLLQLLSPPWVGPYSFFPDTCGLLAHAHWRSSLMALLLPR